MLLATVHIFTSWSGLLWFRIQDCLTVFYLSLNYILFYFVLHLICQRASHLEVYLQNHLKAKFNRIALPCVNEQTHIHSLLVNALKSGHLLIIATVFYWLSVGKGSQLYDCCDCFVCLNSSWCNLQLTTFLSLVERHGMIMRFSYKWIGLLLPGVNANRVRKEQVQWRFISNLISFPKASYIVNDVNNVPYNVC